MTNDSIPLGYCQCGCGEQTRIATRTQRDRGWIKGEPLRFIRWHFRLWETESYVDGDTGWIPLRNREGEIVAWTTVDSDEVGTYGSLRWNRDRHGYAGREQNGRTVLLHRTILGLTYNDGIEGDHIDRDRLNNRRSNLRAVPEHSVNGQNRTSNKGSTSRYRGVSWHSDTRKWAAQAQIDGKNRYLGVFSDEKEAAGVVKAFRLAHMPGAVD